MVLLLLMDQACSSTNKEKLTSNKKGDKNLKNQTMLKIKISQKKQEEETGEQETTQSAFIVHAMNVTIRYLVHLG